MLKDNVLEALRKGKDNAVSKQHLARIFGTDERLIRKAIQELRNDGVFIVSAGRGYYIATEISEIEDYYYIEKARALSILKRLTPAREKLIEEGRKPKI